MGDELDSTAIAYRLLLGWDTAWEKYRGVTRGVGALPGIALLEVAEVVPDEERKLRRYWLSKVRAEINLALRRCQAEGWLARQDVNPSLLSLSQKSPRPCLRQNGATTGVTIPERTAIYDYQGRC